MIFVTGGTGLLGSHLLFELSTGDEPIRAMYRSESRINDVLNVFEFYDPNGASARFDKISWVKGDITDVSSLDELIQEGDSVYHCAALVTFDEKAFNQLLAVNRNGTENVVNVCLDKKVKKLCYTSSTAAIGGEDGSIVDETSKWKNTPETTAYSVSKYCAEREVWRGIEEGLNAVIINPCVILGPGRWNESSLEIFNTTSKGLWFCPPGSNATVDARDVSSAMVKLMQGETSGERYLCVGSNQKFQTLLTEIASQLNVKKPTKIVSRWQVDLARRLLTFGSWFTGKRPKITRDTISNIFGNKSYNTAKIETAIGINFRPLEEQVSNSIAGRLD
jgi:nucleoside-diphosphate-sugar epimerase